MAVAAADEGEEEDIVEEGETDVREPVSHVTWWFF